MKIKYYVEGTPRSIDTNGQILFSAECIHFYPIGSDKLLSIPLEQIYTIKPITNL